MVCGAPLPCCVCAHKSCYCVQEMPVLRMALCHGSWGDTPLAWQLGGYPPVLLEALLNAAARPAAVLRWRSAAARIMNRGFSSWMNFIDKQRKYA